MLPFDIAGILTKLVTGINVASVIPSLLDSIKQYWKVYLISAALALQVFTAYEWQHNTAQLKIERRSHKADIASYRQAQADAEAKVKVQQAALKKESQEKANAADKSYATLLATYHANLVRYKTLEGIRVRASGGAPSGTSQVPNGPGKGPDIPTTVTITAEDAETCAVNTARLSNAHDWALSLQGGH